MQRIVDPRQTRLFDPFSPVLTEATRRRLEAGWPGVFRHVILELMPVDTLAGNFHPTMGRPTKELYSMAGLVLLSEWMNWTTEHAVEAYCFYMNVQYALNLEPVAQALSKRTLERYLRHFEQDQLAQRVLREVTARLVEVLGIRIDRQRLDSTHLFSDMACLGRTRLMGVAVKRFLTQVKRHDPAAYAELDEPLRQRYVPSTHRLFAETGKQAGGCRRLRQQVADDMYALVRQFSQVPEHAKRTSYRAMERVFYEQCDVEEAQVVVKAKTGGEVMQNPSDPDASYDGHKGPGYQVQLSETCHPDNEAQLIVATVPQTAAVPDAASLEPVLETLQAQDLLPEEMLLDSQYTSDDNVQTAETQAVELVGPAAGAQPLQGQDDLSIDDFVIDEATEQVVRCPNGHEPTESVHNPVTGRTKTTMPPAACDRCPCRDQCPVRRGRDGYELRHTAKQRRSEARRREQTTEVFAQRYGPRNGIEGTNSGIKRRTGLGRLRVRGRPRVFMAIYLKIAGWNILRASVCAAMRQFVAERVKTALQALDNVLERLQDASDGLLSALSRQIVRFLHHPAPNPIHTSTQRPDFRRIHLLIAFILTLGSECLYAENIAPTEVRTIAKEAYIYGFPKVMNTKTVYDYAVNTSSPDYK